LAVTALANVAAVMDLVKWAISSDPASAPSAEAVVIARFAKAQEISNLIYA